LRSVRRDPVKASGRRPKARTPASRRSLSSFLVQRPGRSPRKGKPSDNPIIRWFASFRETSKRFGSFAAISAGCLLLVAIYGAFAGGHVSRWLEQAENAIYSGLGGLGFAVEDISLYGRNRTNLEQIKRVVDMARGDAIFAVDCNDIRDRLLAIEWVADAQVMRKLPSTVLISITEKEPFAIWQQDGNFRLIDRAGSVITEKNVGMYHDLPMVVDDGANEQAAQIVDLLNKFPQIREQVKAAAYVSQRRWDLHMKSGIQVMLSQEEPELGLKRLDTLIREQDILRRAISMIDLRLKDRFVIRVDGGGVVERGEAT
jgi:cell division protein FtsQ